MTAPAVRLQRPHRDSLASGLDARQDTLAAAGRTASTETARDEDRSDLSTYKPVCSAAEIVCPPDAERQDRLRRQMRGRQ